MYNKKGAMPAEEIRGLLTFVFVAAIILLLYYGCSVNRVKQDYTKFELVKDEIEAVKALNYFLEMRHPTNPEKKVMDLVIESYIDDDYEELNNTATAHFSDRYDSLTYVWALLVVDYNDGCKLKYNSFFYVQGQDSCDHDPDAWVENAAETKIPIISEDREIIVALSVETI